MKKVLFLFGIFLFFFTYSSGQTQISGVVNQYAAVQQIDYCANVLFVDDPNSFNVGDRVLVVQMKGASINIANNSGFGEIANLNQAGKHEFNTIAEINGNEILLENEFVHPYSAASSVQLIQVPVYQDVIISDTLSAMPWDGTKGGIIVIDATGTIQINSVIQVSGMGFRGGQFHNSGYQCSWISPQSDYYYTLASGRAGRKGEGIVNFNTAFECGRGPYGNGGGGGNDHNTGGGGGSNFGEGGSGGKRLTPSEFFCNGEYRGIGGNPIIYQSGESRFLFGGGGGAGHVDDSLGTGGANGGGLVILKASEIVSNAGSILANGDHAEHGSYDGVGGGGAGGSVLLFSNSFQNTLHIEAKGGNGGNVSDDLSNTCYGPGGGGGGGFIGLSSTSIPTNIIAETSGGNAGINLMASTECAAGDNDPQDGESGGYQTELFFVESTELFVPPVFTLSADTIICPGDTIQLEASGGEDYLWSPTANLTCTNCPDPMAFPFATTQYAVTMFAGVCEHIDTVTVEVRNMPQISITPEEVHLCFDTTITLTATGAPDFDYVWTGGDLSSSESGNTISVNPQQTETYTVQWTDADELCTVYENVTVHLSLDGFGTFPEDKNICLGQSIQLNAAGGTDYKWSPSNSLSCDDCPNPVADPQETTTYQLIISNNFGCIDTGTFTIYVDEPVSFSAPDTIGVCMNSSEVIELNGTGDFNWSPPTYLSCTNCPNPEIVQPQSEVTYAVTLTNGACSYTDSIHMQPLAYPPFVLVYDTIYLEFNEPFEVQWDTTALGYTFQWSPDIGIDDTSSANPIITAISPGTYTVTITDSETGCSITESFYISLTAEELDSYDLVPNAFFPTGGGVNAKIGPFDPGPGHDFVSFRVFNRWGQLMFQGSSFDDGWDGYYRGQAQPMETYVYEFVFKLPDGNTKRITGDVILIR